MADVASSSVGPVVVVSDTSLSSSSSSSSSSSASIPPADPIGLKPKRSLLIIDAGYAHNGAILHAHASQMVDWLALVSHLALVGPLAGVAFVAKYYLTFQTKNANLLEYNRSLTNPLPQGPGFQLREFRRHRKGLHSLDYEAQQEVDVMITTLMLTHGYEGKYDQLVLFARKGAYLDALDTVRNKLQKEIVIIGFRQSLSPKFQAVASRVVWMEDMWDIVHRPILPDLVDFSIGADCKGKRERRQRTRSGGRRSDRRERGGGGNPMLGEFVMGSSGDDLLDDFNSSTDLDEQRIDTYEQALIQLMTSRTETEEAEALNYQVALLDKDEYVIRQENADYGILMAEDRNRRQRHGRLTVEDEETDRVIAEQLQKDYLEGRR